MAISKEDTFKIILCGDSFVGKTCIFNQFCDNTKLNPDTRPTNEAKSHSKKKKYRGKNIILEMWDTAGNETFDSFSNSFYQTVDCLIFVYDFPNPGTFKSVQQKYQKIVQNVSTPSQFYRVLMGNKSDRQRSVFYDEGNAFANDNNFDLFMETSIHDPEQIELIFDQILRDLSKRDPRTRGDEKHRAELARLNNRKFKKLRWYLCGLEYCW